MLSTDLKNTTT